jgi:transcriptional regulator with GAF, ATPase, and Fis domain
MRCLNCGHHVREAAKFCGECGGPLELSRSERGTRGFADSSARAESDHGLEGTSASSASHFQKSQHFLDMILRTGACLSKTMDLDHYLRVVIAELAKAMESEAAGVLLYDDHLDGLYPREVWDPKRRLVPNATDREFRIDPAAIDRAFQTGEPVLLGNSADTAACDKAGRFHAEGSIHSALILPLNTREKTRGLLILANKKIDKFTEEDIRVGLAVGGVVALSVENADSCDELLDSYRKVVGLERMKSKIMHRISHELKTPLAVIKGSLRPMENRMKELGMQEFDASFVRLRRQVQNLDRLEFQVEFPVVGRHA